MLNQALISVSGAGGRKLGIRNALTGFVLTWCQLESSERKKTWLTKHLHKIQLQDISLSLVVYVCVCVFWFLL